MASCAKPAPVADGTRLTLLYSFAQRDRGAGGRRVPRAEGHVCRCPWSTGGGRPHILALTGSVLRGLRGPPAVCPPADPRTTLGIAPVGGGPACLCSVAHRRWHQAPLCPPGARCLPTVAAVTHSSRMPGKWLFLSLESESRALSFTKPWAPHLEIGLWSLDTSGETSEFPRGLLKVGRRESWAAGPLCSQYPHASAAPS